MLLVGQVKQGQRWIWQCRITYDFDKFCFGRAMEDASLIRMGLGENGRRGTSSLPDRVNKLIFIPLVK